jgi:hypothetical protein
MNGLRQFAALCAFAALWICSEAAAASVRAWLDRTNMQLGETVTLNVEVSGDNNAAQPDLSALAADFDLLGTQSSTSLNIVNGQSSAKLLWAVGLSPKRDGTLTIPPLSVAGQQTPALTLSVQPATAGGSAGGDVYVETSVEPRAPYVQQQIRLSVKLFYAVNLLDGNLAEPQGEGLLVRKLGQDSNYTASVGGHTYHVVERRYALFPEKSGALILPAIAFRGHAVQGNNSLDIFFNRGREIGARSAPVTFDVRPRPAASGDDTWLPARSLTLSASGIDASSTVRAGEPLTLTLRMQAQGLGFEQLPELKLPALDGVDIYPDKSNTQNRDDGEWLFGQRERKFAIVPNRSGALTLPAISVSWWDTAHDRSETAVVPAMTLDVQPGAAGAAAAANAPAAAATPSPSLPSAASPSDGEAIAIVAPDGAVSLWRSVALAAIVLWLTTLGVVAFAWRSRRQRVVNAPPETASASESRKRFREACAGADLAAASRELLAWAQQSRPQLRNLGEVARCVSDPAQRDAIGELERSRYGAVVTADLSATLQRVFRSGPAFAPPVGTSAATALPTLYPFRT